MSGAAKEESIVARNSSVILPKWQMIRWVLKRNDTFVRCNMTYLDYLLAELVEPAVLVFLLLRL